MAVDKVYICNMTLSVTNYFYGLTELFFCT